jgi:hypothetical protein
MGANGHGAGTDVWQLQPSRCSERERLDALDIARAARALAAIEQRAGAFNVGFKSLQSTLLPALSFVLLQAESEVAMN